MTVLGDHRGHQRAGDQRGEHVEVARSPPAAQLDPALWWWRCWSPIAAVVAAPLGLCSATTATTSALATSAAST